MEASTPDPTVARPGPVTIAPAPSKTTTPSDSRDSPLPQANLMPYTCQSCVRRKVRCDRTIPACSSCAKTKLECIYRAPPPPRPRRRKRSTGDGEDVDPDARGNLPRKTESPSHKKEGEPRQGNKSLVPVRTSDHVDPVGIGTLLSGNGKSRYIDSRLWVDARKELDVREMSGHEEDDDQNAPVGNTRLVQNPISSALLGDQQSLSAYHPDHQDAMKLWATHVQNVEPLCKVLHIPTTARIVETVSQQPLSASRADECLLFSIYHFAVFSMADDSCMREFGQSRTALLHRYQFAVRQALVNASWLKTTEMPVMQAYVLFLIVMRSQTDHNTFWIMTGVAIRIAQRMGLHRDGESLGLPPFDVQMRRRLWWQLLPLDGYAGQLSGTGISVPPNSWDTKPPLNVNDDQIYPGMTHWPEERKGASEMIFCLTRVELSNFYTRTGVRTKDIGPAIELRDSTELDKLINEVEDTIETKYLRYCEIVNPLHFLTLAVARSAMNVVRLHNRMKRTMGDVERRELYTLAQKILDSDSAVYRDLNLNKFHWHTRASFLWDALICTLSSLAKPDFFTPAELDSTWSRMADVYANHYEIVEGRGAFHIAVGKATLEAWKVNPPSDSMQEPAFIAMLRSQRSKNNATKRPDVVTSVTTPSSGTVETTSSLDALSGGLDGTDLNFEEDFNSMTTDWMFWDQFSHPHGPHTGRF